jgi:SAM-dependent methyltransferase
MEHSPFPGDEPDERERWNRKYRESPGSWLIPDPFLRLAFSRYIVPLFPDGGNALDLAGGAGRHAIWLAQHGWEVTLIDVSETGVEQARQHAGQFGSHIHFVVDDLTHFKASQTQFAVASDAAIGKRFESRFGLVMAFFYLERTIFPEMVKALRPGGLLIYKTFTWQQRKRADGPKDPSHLLRAGELRQLVDGLRILHYREKVEEKATVELVARKEV